MTRKTIATNTTTSLGDSGNNTVSTKVIQLTGSAWSAGTLTVVGRLAGTTDAWVPIPYRRRYVNGAVGDENFGSAALTADSLIEVNAAGIEVGLTSAGLVGSVAADYLDLAG